MGQWHKHYHVESATSISSLINEQFDIEGDPRKSAIFRGFTHLPSAEDNSPGCFRRLPSQRAHLVFRGFPRCRLLRAISGETQAPWRRKKDGYRIKILVLLIWRFPEIGVPPNHPFIVGFSFINHPYLGVPPFLETPIFGFLYNPRLYPLSYQLSGLSHFTISIIHKYALLGDHEGTPGEEL